MKKVALVTGASRGIGRAIAQRLAREGYDVIGFYRDSAVEAAKAMAEGIDIEKVDVGNEQQVRKAITNIARKHGQIDVVINNAGINIGGSIEHYAPKDWGRMLATDLTSVFLVSKFSIPYLKRSSNPSIINISSRIGLREYAEADFVAYSAVKAAVNSFTAALAKELKPLNIRVNAIIPTPTKTNLFNKVFTPEDEAALNAKGKLGTPEDVAELVFKTINDKSLTGELVFDRRVFL